VEIKSNSEFQSLTLNPTLCPGPPWFQIDIREAYEMEFIHSTYAREGNEKNFPVALVPGPTKIGLDHNCQNNVNMQSPTHPGAIHIKTDAQVSYDIQLGSPWTPWKGKEISFPIELVPWPNSSRINRNH
jgi:hypothetical protein